MPMPVFSSRWKVVTMCSANGPYTGASAPRLALTIRSAFCLPGCSADARDDMERGVAHPASRTVAAALKQSLQNTLLIESPVTVNERHALWDFRTGADPFLLHCPRAIPYTLRLTALFSLRFCVLASWLAVLPLPPGRPYLAQPFLRQRNIQLRPGNTSRATRRSQRPISICRTGPGPSAADKT